MFLLTFVSKMYFMFKCCCFVFFATFMLVAKAQTSYVWNGGTSTDWGTNTNWTPNGIPGPADNVTIVTGGNNCVLAANTTITNLTITSGVLNLNTFSLTTTGVVACNGGNCNNGSFSSTATSLTFAGTTFGANVIANVADVYFNGSTFNGSLTVTKNSASNIGSTGNNVFNGVTSITNAGTGYLLLTNGAAGRNETFNTTTTFNTTNTGALYIGYTRDVAFNANVIVNNTSSTGNIQIGRVGVVTLNTGITITCGTFSGASLNLYNISQTGSTAQTLSPGNAGGVNIYGSTINGNLTINAGIISAQTSTFATAVTYSVGGTILNTWSSGGNIYNGVLTVNNSSNGYIGFANGTADTYNADVYANNTSTTGGRIIFGNNCTSQFNGNLYVSQSGPNTSAGGIAIGWGGAFPIINMAATKGIITSGTYNSGYLQLYRVQQADATPITLNTTGSANVLLNGNVFTGNVTITAPDITPYGGTYNGATVFNKTGGTSNHNNGNLNIFNSTLTINQTSNTGYFMLGYNSADQFNEDITVTSTGTGGIHLGHSSGTGTPTLASGKTVLIGGAGFIAGFLRFGGFTQLGSAAINLNFTGTAYLIVNSTAGPSTFGGAFTVVAPDIYIQGGTFNGATVFTKTGGVSNHNSGGQNIFNSTLAINQQSNTGYFMLGYNSADQFNEDITVTSNGSGGINLGWSGGTGTPTLAAGKTILVGGAGFSAGYLRLGGFTQLGSAAINLNFTGTAYLIINALVGPCVFGGAFSATAADIYVQGGTFNGATVFTKTGGTSNHNNGNQNIFNSTLTINQQSTTNYFMLGYNSNDLFNDDITVTNTGTQGVYLGYSSGTGTPILASGKTIMIGGAGFSGGFLYFGGFTQLGSTAVNLVLTGVTTVINFRASTFGGDVTVTSPSFWLSGSTFNGMFNATKTGTPSDPCPGGNTFNGTATITNNGSGYFGFSWSSPDTWNGDVTFTNTGSERILPAWNAAGNLFNGNITVNSTGSSTGIHFCGGGVTATATLAATKAINTGTFDKGYLILTRFTQLGSASNTLNLTTGSTYLQFGPTSNFGGDVTASSLGLLFNSTTFNGVLNALKTGTSNDQSPGGNTFNGVSTFSNTGSGYLMLGNVSPDTWNNNVTFYNSGSERILPCWNSAGNMFNGNITVSSTGSSTGIHFCNGATATATMSAGNTINTGTFDKGYLILTRFTQLGSAAVNLTLSSGSNYLQYGPSSVLGGNVTSTSPGLFFNGCTFNGTTDCTKTGSTGDYSTGGNIFNGVSTITNSGASFLALGNTSADIWNNDVTFTNNGTERLLPCWATAGNLFNGNIYVNTSGSAQGIQFCGGNATATATLAATKTIAAGVSGLNAGYLILKQFTQLGNAPINLTLAGSSTYLQYGPISSLGGNVTSVSPRLLFNGCTFNGTANCTKNGAVDDAGIGNNIFNGDATMTNSGSGYLMFGNGNKDMFNSASTFNNIGSSHIYVAYNTGVGTTFGGVATFNNAPTANTGIYVSPYSVGTVFNDNIIVTSTNGQGIQFCGGNTIATATLSATKTISVGGAGFSVGTLLLKQFTQVGATAQNLTLTGTGNLTFGPTSSFGGDVTSSSPAVLFNGCNFNRTLTSTKTGSTNDGSTGGNIFNGVTVITNNGAGYLLLGNTTRDQFNAATTFNNNGDYRFYFAHSHGGQTTTFAGDLTVNSNKSVSDGWSYLVCEGNNTSFSVAGNFVINCGGTAQSNYRFLNGSGTSATYSSDATINLTNSHSSTQIQMGTTGTSLYNGNIITSNTLGGTSSGVFFNIGATASSTLALTKTITLGAGGFNSGTLSLIRFTQLGSTSQALAMTTGNAALILGPTSRFDGDVNFNFPQVYLNGTTYNGLATIQKNGATDNPGTGGNIFNGTTIINNTGGGYLLTGNTNRDQFNALTTFNNTGTYRIFLAHNHSGQTTTFAQDVIFNSNKSGGGDGWSYFICEGNNTSVSFAGNVTYNITGSVYSNCRILQGTGTTATYNGDLTYNLSNSHVSTQMQLGVTGLSYYNGNVVVTNSGGANGVYFNVNSTASSTLATSKAISIGGAGFSSGTLSLARFTQLGSTPQTLTLTGTTTNLTFGPTSVFNGNVTSSSPSVFFTTNIFNGSLNSTKNGTANDASTGGNTFNGTTTLTANGTGYLLMANASSDAYNGDITFVQSNTGIMYPNHNTNCTYAGNVTVSSPTTYIITFGQAAGGIATFNGGANQTINKLGSTGNPVFTRLVINKSAGDVTLNTRVNVSTYLTLTQGIVNTTSANILNMNNASTTTIGNSLSYINGPMNYDMALNGARTLNFPIGKSTDWRPAVLALNHNNATSYTYKAEVTNASAKNLNWTLPATVNLVSLAHYWDIDRANTSTGVNTPTLHLNGNQTITLYYDANDGVTDPANLTICKNTNTATTTWIDIGGTGATITTGSISSTSTPSAFSSFSRFTLGNRLGGINPLPIELLYFTGTKINDYVSLDWATASELNNDYFDVERSIDGINFEYVQLVKAYGSGTSYSKQEYATIDKKPYKGISYYRLKQVDKNGDYRYTNNVSVEFNAHSYVNVYPNPASNQLTIKTSENYREAHVRVINTVGVIVKSTVLLSSYSGVIDVSDLASGIYYVVIESDNSIAEVVPFAKVL